MVKSLREPISWVEIEMRKSVEIRLVTCGSDDIYVTLKSPENDGESTSLNDLPASVKVSHLDPEYESTWSNQGLSYKQWIQCLSSVFENQGQTDVMFHIRQTRFAVPSFRNTFPKLKRLFVINRVYDPEPTDEDVLYAENFLKVFLPVVEKARLYRVPIRENFSLQHIGMTNLKGLELGSDHNVKFDDLLTLNVESLNIDKTKNISLRDLNRFFKLWMKGSFPRLKEFWIQIKTRTVPDWNILLKGLKAKEAEEEIHRRFIIKNCRGVFAELLLQYVLHNYCCVSISILD
ncbi:hypothetical protein B9Z55_011096 [Caenorhabditis nigoni]|nr:hypothetical protein B9Z55_011096 [Caenorhabditis nigoni]